MPRQSSRIPHARLGALDFQGLPANVKRKGEHRSFTCPVCGGGTAVIDSRPRGSGVKRRRACLDDDCGCRFTTAETIVTAAGDYDTQLESLLSMVSAMKAQVEAVEAALLIATAAATYADANDEAA